MEVADLGFKRQNPQLTKKLKVKFFNQKLIFAVQLIKIFIAPKSYYYCPMTY